MKNITKLMVAMLVMIIGTSTNLFCASKVTFKNQLDVTVTLTGPRGSKSIDSGKSASIMPQTDPVDYTVQAEGYSTYSGSARGGSTYTITNENGAIKIS